MSKVAKEVNADPNSEAKIKPLNRDDELAELASSINQMLDRMQVIWSSKAVYWDVSQVRTLLP